MKQQSLTYPGGKAGAGVYQTLINQIPPHQTYIAAFAGRDAIARHKRPASKTILIDLDPRPLDWWAQAFPNFELHNADAIEWLRYHFGLTRYPSGRDAQNGGVVPGSRSTADTIGGEVLNASTFVFVDPPYPMSTRSSGPIYRHELTDGDHQRLLEVLTRLPAAVMVCSYPSDLYASALSSWRCIKYQTVTRSGARRIENAWCNYPAPTQLHDSAFIGRDKREREKIRRRVRRLSRSLTRLPTLERQAVLDMVAQFGSGDAMKRDAANARADLCG